MSFDVLHERLLALQAATSQLRDLIDRLATLKFQPGSVPLGADEESSVSGELSSEISSMLRNGLDDQELLSEEIKYLRPEGEEKTRLLDGIEKVGNDLTSHRIEFRRARLTAKKSLIDAQRLERQLVMQSYSQPRSDDNTTDGDTDDAQIQSIQVVRRRTQQLHQSSLSEEDQQTVGASSNVTNALRRTHDMIASELSRSEFAHQTLTESSATLKQLNDSYGSLDTMLVKSRDLLGTLLRSQKSDTWYLQTAMYMLLVTGAWLVFRRLLYGPIWWLVLLPLRIIFGVGWKATSAIMPAKSAPLQSGAAADGKIEQKVPVQGLPDETLPTIQIPDEDLKKETSAEAIKEMVDKVVSEEAVSEEAVSEEVVAEHDEL